MARVTLYQTNRSNSKYDNQSNEVLTELKRLEFKINELSRLIRGFISTNR